MTDATNPVETSSNMQPRSLPRRWCTLTRCYITSSFIGNSVHLLLRHTTYIPQKGKAIPLHAWTGPKGSRRLRLPISKQLAHEGGNVVSLTHRPPLHTGNIPGTHFCWRLSRPHGNSAAGRIMLVKKFSDTIGNRTLDLPACNAVPQATALRRDPVREWSDVFSAWIIDGNNIGKIFFPKLVHLSQASMWNSKSFYKVVCFNSCLK